MEAIGFIDAGVSILRLIALSADIVDAVNRICARYKKAKLKLQGLMIQMVALRAALDQIQVLANTVSKGRDPPQFGVDLEMCLMFCEHLLETLDNDIKELNKDQGLLEPVFMIRLKTAFNDGPVSDMAAMLDRHTNALSLILTTHSSHTLQQQNELLQRPEQSHSDVASLQGLRDCESIFSQSTDLLSKVSREFDFDSAILATAPYAAQSDPLIALLRKRLH
ncbi:hypothetical protein NLG97_g8538 [Lecanicillium saksenae]|uniref:Uncharacterized protein n=1 Tax=Lecanicillium saksenae TaxID=468837 RepID=A0ACC1QMH4_9HYPO|nr:hypothetical protein NLG97_g8538 [Lecanicillium saksenae]